VPFTNLFWQYGVVLCLVGVVLNDKVL
jgi:hypothetical protein